MDMSQWQAQFAEAAAHLEQGAKTGDFAFADNVAYPVTIEAARPVKAPRGDIQLQLDLSVRDHAGEDSQEVGKSRQWVTLPYQESDFQLDPAVVAKRHAGRKADIGKLLARADAATYALYARRVPRVTKGYDYYDFADKPMSATAFTHRKREVDEAVEAAVQTLHASVDQPAENLQGASLYLVRKPSAKAGGKAYNTFHGEVPDGVQVARATGNTAAVPF